MSLPTQPADLPYPPGNSGLVRAAAADIRSTLEQLRTAKTAAVRLDDITSGAHWRGDAFDAFRRATEVKPLPEAIDHASGRMTLAADRLDWFADRFVANTSTIRWCRSRLAALGLDGGEIPEELLDEVNRIQWDAERAWDDHRSSLRSVADLFDWLDDEPTFAQPPPSNWDRVRGAAGHVGSFILGIGEECWELLKFSAELTMWLNPITGPLKWREAWENRDQIIAVLQYAWNNPGEFALEIGKAMIDLETLREDGVARWLGRRVPGVVLAIATGGLGTVGTGAAMTVRGARGGRAATALLRTARSDHLFKPVDVVGDASDAARRLGAERFLNRLNRLGADADRLDRLTDLGAFSRTDTALGRLATRLDAHRSVEVGRQLPGLLNDEIKGFTQLPRRFLQQQFPGHPIVDGLSATVQYRFDSVVTGGVTGRLGMIDGLLVGGPVLSPETRRAMVGVLGASVTSELEGLRDIVVGVHGAATEAGS